MGRVQPELRPSTLIIIIITTTIVVTITILHSLII